MKITDEELKLHFGPMWEFQHLVNLRDRTPENRNHYEESLKFAKIELENTIDVVDHLKRCEDGKSSVEHFSRSVEILRELIG